MGEDGLLYPDLLPPEEDAPTYGKYGRLRLTYLKQHRSTLYASLTFPGRPHPLFREPAGGMPQINLNMTNGAPA